MAEIPVPTDEELNRAIEQVAYGMGFHPGNEDVAHVYSEIRTRYIELGEFVAQALPTGRSKSIALTELEDSLMWAIKSVALTQPLGEERK